MNGLGPKEDPVKKPLIRWAGGKRSIVPTLISCLPKKYGSYFEPMVGGGALFFAICPERAVIADINPELVNFYSVIKHKPHQFTRAIEELRALKTTYESFRKSSPSCSLERAVRFFYLIRLSWNGIYRVNRKGKFNVPFGRRRPKTLVTREAIEATSKALRQARLMCGDLRKPLPTLKLMTLFTWIRPIRKAQKPKSTNQSFRRRGLT